MTPWKKTFASSFTAQILSILGFSFAFPFLPFFIAELGVEKIGDQAFWSGIVLSSAGLTFAVFAPVWGVLADRHGRKPMVCRAMFGGAMVLCLMSNAQTPGQLVFFRFLQGALAGTVAVSVALVVSVVPERRSGVTLGMMQAAVLLGNSMGPFLGVFAADAFGYRTAFRLGALLCLSGGLFVYFGTKENFLKPGAEEQGSVPGFREIFFLKGFFVAVLIMFGVRCTKTMLNPSFPLIIRDILPGVENLNSITGAVRSAAVLGHAGDRMGHRGVLVGCCIAASVYSLGHYFALTVNNLVAAGILFWRWQAYSPRPMP